jgi:toxin ParE1/3/4
MLDLDDCFAYIAQDNMDMALQFFDAARQTFSQVAKTPGIGSPYQVENTLLLGLRKWKIQGFGKYLIFYLTQDESIEVLRILHASRDIPVILERED